ncbi:uncharacterized protein LACBIDRAFT_316648 [Laccaria bicolor S238N-H82]|uniref:Predicted protein n=1 Tax=Laccaria bicolor (strain S238N-H82 / ATCC MYA-4686) TaxID=486041 RepID=B0E1C7_LACBS|nr:uncharacterized protein LACBIDRAFT_316648 [Laccaria bicolor S238N-H82]EDQ99358.1 predicted protein [Laccaria bicolor S238N-H82]|eukprot:XP_001890004.1 predicted protein [Laccaria bicolor S238N-H82]
MTFVKMSISNRTPGPEGSLGKRSMGLKRQRTFMSLRLCRQRRRCRVGWPQVCGDFDLAPFTDIVAFTTI